MALTQTERRDGVLLLGIDRPDKHNAIDQEMVDEIDAVLHDAQRGDPAVLIIHSTTAGMFVSGAISLAERIGQRSWRALELTKLSLRQYRPATTGLDIAAQALQFESVDKRQRMQAFLDKR